MRPTKSADIEVSLSRRKSLSLLKRLRKSSVTLNIKRGRVTAAGMWLQLEISGANPQVDEAIRLTRSASSIFPMEAGTLQA